MSQDPPEKSPPGRSGSTSSDLSGTSWGGVVQARDVDGGVHYHQTPPAAPRATVPRQLPGDVRGFVGRARELSRLDAILAEHDTGDGGALTICAIAGTAGVGKTSLAVHWAHRVRARFPDGQLYVNLRGYDPGAPVGPAEALERFLHALDVGDGAIPVDVEDRAALFRSILADRRVLMVLDNAALVGQVRLLLPGSGLVVVTSRDRLSGLVAREGAHRVTLDALSSSEAVELVQATTAGHRPADDPAELAELARLCARLPLALRIAAERAAVRPHSRLAELIEDLRGESSLWDALSIADEDEADSVRAVFAWSYRALPARAARLFRLLGLHPGPDFGPHAAAALAAEPPAHARNLLDLLAGAHLIEQHAPDRYRFHDLLRAYALDQTRTEESPEARHEALHRVLSWYLHTAAAAAAVSQSLMPPVPLGPPAEGAIPLVFPDHTRAVAWYRGEQGNLPDATRAARDAGLDEIAWRFPAVVFALHIDDGPLEGSLAMGEIALDAARRLGERAGEALILTSLGTAHNKSGRPEQAITSHRAALAIREEIGDRAGRALSLNLLGVAHLRVRKLDDARWYFEDFERICEELDDRPRNALALANLAHVAADLGDHRTAIDLAERSLEIYRALDGNPIEQVSPMGALSIAHRAAGRPDLALVAAEEALALARDEGNLLSDGWVLLELGRVQRALHRHDEALATYQRCAAIYRKLGNRTREAQALDATGETHHELGHPELAVDFHRTAATFLRAQDEFRWLLALALANLATALDATGEPDRAREHRQEAAILLAAFPDPVATAAHERLTALLAHRPPNPPNTPHP